MGSSPYEFRHHIWGKVFKSGPSKICLGRPYPFKFFKGCLPQILLGPLLNTLSHIIFIIPVKSRAGFILCLFNNIQQNDEFITKILAFRFKSSDTWKSISSLLILELLIKPTTIYKIRETNSSFFVKQRTTGKVQFLFFSSFFLILTKFSFWEKTGH